MLTQLRFRRVTRSVTFAVAAVMAMPAGALAGSTPGSGGAGLGSTATVDSSGSLSNLIDAFVTAFAGNGYTLSHTGSALRIQVTARLYPAVGEAPRKRSSLSDSISAQLVSAFARFILAMVASTYCFRAL